MDKNEKKEEGARSFSRFIDQLGDGAAHSELSQEVHQLIQKLSHEAKARNTTVRGALTLSLKFASDSLGHVAIVYDVTTKEPKPQRVGDMFFVTKGGNLSKRDERQAELPLVRDVSVKRAAAVDVGGAPKAMEPVTESGDLIDPETGEVMNF